METCPVCGSPARTTLHTGLTDRVMGCAPGEWSLHACSACGSAYLDPRPTPASIGRAYATYHTHAPVADYAPPPATRAESLRRSLLNGYVNRRYGYGFRPASAVGHLICSAVPTARGTAAHLVRALPNPAEGAGLLDVGCGNGEFLSRIRGTRWRAEGLEPDPTAAQHARDAGLTVHDGLLETDSAGLGTYRAVTLSHVIEHLHDPVAGLRRCFELLEPGGTIWMATPNIEATGHRRFGRDWLALDPPRHLVLFTHDSLRIALRKAGFELPAQPPPMATARWMYRASAAVRAGVPPMVAPPPLTRADRSAARRADMLAVVNRDTAEEIVMVGRRPTSP